MQEPINFDNMIVGEFFMVELLTQDDNQSKHYIGELLDLQHDSNVYVFFFLRYQKFRRLIYPNITDKATVQRAMIRKKIIGNRLGTTKRQKRTLSIDVDVTKYNIFLNITFYCKIIEFYHFFNYVQS